MELFVGLIAIESLNKHKFETVHNFNFFSKLYDFWVLGEGLFGKVLAAQPRKPEFELSVPTLNP